MVAHTSGRPSLMVPCANRTFVHRAGPRENAGATHQTEPGQVWLRTSDLYAAIHGGDVPAIS